MKTIIKKTVEKFLEEWGHNKEIIGVVVCGSYVTGNPTKHSDIDLQIILDEGIKWRERGNRIINGIFLVSSFGMIKIKRRGL
jgi:predicted nucleotidyltransferase